MFKQTANTDFTFIVFGASGNLAALKIYPALYDLYGQKRLDAVAFKIVGFSRTDFSDASFRDFVAESIRTAHKGVDEKLLERFLAHVFYVTGQYDDPQAYIQLQDRLQTVEGIHFTGVRLAYFSVPPSVFKPILEGLTGRFDTAEHKLRLILEKPFGYDSQTAKELMDLLLENFAEEQLYLLDHYLGKEAVFNVLTLRYANSILQDLLRGREIANIQINTSESIGIKERAGYFDTVGIFRDMVQSHLLQILALLLMDLPIEITADSVQKAKRHVLERLVVRNPQKSLYRGQYVGTNEFASYREEHGVADDSTTETYAAIRLFWDSGDFANVPIYIRGGKRLASKCTQIVIEFKKSHFFEDAEANRLVLEIQPQEKIGFDLNTKIGGAAIAVRPIETTTSIQCDGDCLPEHGRLLLEAMEGSRLLYLSFGEILAAWELVDPLVELFANGAIPLYMYESGSHGPKEAEALLAQDGFTWHDHSC